MNEYLKCSNRYLLDRRTWTFVSEAKKQTPCNMDVFTPYWEGDGDQKCISCGFQLGGSSLQSVYNRLFKTHLLDLNACRVTVNDYFMTQLQFQDNTTGGVTQIAVSVSSAYRGSTRRQLTKFVYDLNVNGGNYKFEQAVPSFRDQFKPIAGLITMEANNSLYKVLSIGISHKPFRVKYKGRELGGVYYALVRGPLAILLTPDMHFDSLVCLNGASSSELSICKVFYTVSPYITKAMFMWGK